MKNPPGFSPKLNSGIVLRFSPTFLSLLAPHSTAQSSCPNLS
jgi:hypothetical protein